MSAFRIHTIESAPEGAKDALSAVRKKYGFVPNLMGELAAAPPALKAYATLSELLSQTSLSPIEQQLVLAAASIANGCEYCVAMRSSRRYGPSRRRSSRIAVGSSRQSSSSS